MPSQILPLARRHWLFLLLLGFGTALRAVTFVTYHPALIRRDSVGYLHQASIAPEPSLHHPYAYPLFLKPFPLDEHLSLVPAVQHLLGLGVALLIYALLLHLGVRTWLAALAAAPVLLDGYQLQIEQYVLSETLFELLLIGGCALLLWRRPLDLPAAGLAGLAFAAAALTRNIGIVAVLPALLAAVFLAAPLPWRARLLRGGAFLALCALPLAGYAVWFHSAHGEYALTSFGGRVLFGRVWPFADCTKFSVPRGQRVLCPRGPVDERPTANEAMWSQRLSPILRLEPPPGSTRDETVGDFARRVVRNQPVDYARAVGSDLVRVFAPIRTERRDDVPLARWRFHRRYAIAGGRTWSDASALDFPSEYATKPADKQLARFLRRYQRVAYTYGPVFAAGLLAGLLAALGVGRARRSGLRSAAFLFSSIGLALLIGSVAVALFNWRYVLPQVVVLPPAFALGITALTM